MPTPPPIAFAKGASAYKTYLDSPHGRLRLEIIWHQMSRFMAQAWGAASGLLQILDVGCGTGELALRLAARGHAVTLLDPVDEMLYLAKEKAQVLEPPPARPPRFLQASLEDAPELLERTTFDLLLCHAVMEYLVDPASALIPMRALVRPGGHLSLVALNRRQEPLRLAIRDGKFDEARRAVVEEESTDSLFGLPRKGMTTEELSGLLETAGIEVVLREGIFVFSDYLPAEVLEDATQRPALLRLEEEAGTRTPLKDMARYLHFWGRRAE